MSSERPIYIALGANLPFNGHSPQETLGLALQSLAAKGVRTVRLSSFWTSPAWPDPAKPAYVNAIAEISTDQGAPELLAILQSVEEQFGRVREARWDSRTLDLDIIDFSGLVMGSETLTLPHPRASERGFVLLPLQEIAPHWRHPVSDRAISSLISTLDQRDRDVTRRLD
ncbi:2-amino-4-hydroxy-6-hydroxymethyldihydropteridine diphosphokinase [Hyphobacterium sp. HN65]|uniref:2-amino-4-hydroxy-6-hydroxymethyldihydropteridine pyrophosphokinase n=1 Tax=Hyphobacterium lacteum TaxID=3116575 RepID=A0ABU7LNZ3_9PROT|nr:2-amino-4-hydroxy-6-hydroxymethyldihydropteridine diphosphokinase [Hyphobacterium sp. HN65]MEE2525059.1 2-amino-4-hydroxy-6-hydroxymethyldihydropteridine diphosphokinase [Hyphobacterium sp. HN65]